MDADRPAPATLAKGALRRLALAKQEPTPANFARAYAELSQDPWLAENESARLERLKQLGLSAMI